MKVVVTGAAGFIGSNLIHGLNKFGIDDIIAVDDLTEGSKFQNLLGAAISDYIDKAEFYPRFSNGEFGKIDCIFHQGACSDTLMTDGRYVMEANYQCSKTLLDRCALTGSRFIYASSAATYGNCQIFGENPKNEHPLNIYGYSKLLFDNIVRRRLSEINSQVVGLRYFNVYGPREQHKGRMASVVHHHFNQWRETGSVELFGEYGNYAAGAQMRDFVHVDDVVAVNLWFLENKNARGIFNLGTGRASEFNDVALAAINAAREALSEPALCLEELLTAEFLRYVDFPFELRGKYQCFTQADLSLLRKVGCDLQFRDVATGVRQYFTAISTSILN